MILWEVARRVGGNKDYSLIKPYSLSHFATAPPEEEPTYKANYEANIYSLPLEGGGTTEE